MSSAKAQLNELIEITRDGQRFYQHAAEEVKDPRYALSAVAVVHYARWQSGHRAGCS
jgi:hypothetical protein